MNAKNLMQRTDAAGANYTFAFDPMGRQTAQETFDAGQTAPDGFEITRITTKTANSIGLTARVTIPKTIFFTITMEPVVSRRKSTGVRKPTADGTGVEAPAGYNLYAQTFNQFDPFGNLDVQIDPRGAMTTNTWDALCRLVQSKHLDTNGVTVLSTEGFSYEPGGQVQSHTNALGGVTTTLYTTTGQPESRINADGSTNALALLS